MSYIKNNEWLQPRAADPIHWPHLRRFLLHYLPFWRNLSISVVLSLVASMTAIFIPLIFRALQSALVQRSLRLAWAVVLGYFAIVMMQAVVGYGNVILRSHIVNRLNEDLLVRYYCKLLNISIEDFLEFKQQSNLFQRVIDAMAVTGQFMQAVIQGVQAVIMASILILVIATISVPVLGILLAGGAVLFGFVLSQGSKLREKRRRTLAINYPLVGKMIEIIEGIATVKALSASARVTSDISGLMAARKKADHEELVADSAASFGAQAISSLTLAIALGYAIALLVQHRLDYSQALALYALATALLAPIGEMGRLYQNLSTLSINVRNYYQVLDIPDEGLAVAVAPAAPRAAVAVASSRPGGSVSQVFQAAPAMTSSGRIVLRDIEFAYRRREPILKDLNLTIEPGEKVSLIGRSGSGKTTLVRLLLGFLRPQAGSICIDGAGIEDFADNNVYRRQFGAVGQQDFLFETSLRENMVFGLEETRADAEIQRVLELVHLWEDIAGLQRGLDTVYYHELFSGGQKQRLFIARALLRRPKIVLLDEPTSALDFESEARVIAAIESLSRGRTTITIAHRLSTIRSSSRVLVLAGGRIVASGPHEELYASNDYYRSLCQYNSFML